MTSRKAYMTEKEIQDIERMTEAQIGAWIMRDGTEKTAENIVRLVRAMRICATVANAGWKLVNEIKTTGSLSDATYSELQRTLNLYSPENFPPFAGDLEFGCRMMEELYDFLSLWADHPNGAAVILEKLFERIGQARAALPRALVG